MKLAIFSFCHNCPIVFKTQKLLTPSDNAEKSDENEFIQEKDVKKQELGTVILNSIQRKILELQSKIQLPKKYLNVKSKSR